MNANGTQQLSATLRRRRGTAVILSMMFLILFSTLAVGFAVATEMSSQIAGNERNLSLARTSAESGMTFIRYQLGSITLPSGTNSSNLLQNTATQLASLPALSSTANMGTNVVQVTGSAIYIPSQTAYMSLDSSNSTKFQAVITQSGSNLVVTTHGVGATTSVTRGVQIQFTPTSGNNSILNYGIAAHGPVTLSGNADITGDTAVQGSVLSATAGTSPLTMSGNVLISGDFSDTNASGSLNMSGNVSIAGYTPSNPNFAAHVHKGITTPPFPTVDTSMYLPYATNTYSASSGTNVTVTNAIIPANTNASFSGNTVIQGILYVRTPNKITFSGNVTITGAIVVENNPVGSNNTMTFSGNVASSAINNLPANSTFPAGERALTGSFLLAPTFAVTMSGNFGTVNGSMLADSFSFSGNAGGTVNGSIIALKDVPFTESGNSPFQLNEWGSGIPTGLVFPGGFGATQGSYTEVP
jgi:Tfp pilus assembly protein PilX